MDRFAGLSISSVSAEDPVRLETAPTAVGLLLMRFGNRTYRSWVIDCINWNQVLHGML